MEPYPHQFATALFSFLYHLASYDAGGEALVSCGMMEALLKVQDLTNFFFFFFPNHPQLICSVFELNTLNIASFFQVFEIIFCCRWLSSWAMNKIR